jgi:PAS domain S-box-containing protein
VKTFTRLSFRSRLTLVTVATCGLALLTAAAVVLPWEMVSARREAEASLRSLAVVVGANSTGAVDFRDRRAGEENLAALDGWTDIVAARLFVREGQPLADYRRPGLLVALPERPEAAGLRAEGSDFVIFQPISMNGEALGTLYLRASRATLIGHTKRFATNVALALLVAAIAAGLLASRLHTVLSRSVHALTSAAREVSERSDYSVRAPEIGAGVGEMATLSFAFNGMLSHIQEQDGALRATRDDLETRVRERVADLSREIQERREIEQALRTSETKLKVVVEHNRNLFYSCSPDGVLTYVSPQSRTLLDCEPADALGQRVQWLTDNPANRKGIETTEEAIRTGERQPEYELELRSRTGRLVWVEVSETPVLEDGRCVQIVGALTDITDRKRAETEKAGLEGQLRQAQKMEAIGRLAGGVAHDFNNLLGVIVGYSELVLRQLDKDGKLYGKLEQVLRAADRAAGLTKQLLAFSRKEVVDPKVLDLSAIVHDMEKMLHRLIGEDVLLSVEVPSDLGMILADAGQIEQVLMNLAVNAHDAMPGGGALRIRLTNEDLRTREGGGPAPGQYVVLDVSDTGTGMDEETLSHIFEPFFTTKEQGKGTGLGLATAYGIVEQSGGTIAVHSALGKGTTFRICLPRVGEQRTASPVETPRLQHGRGETILLVEDEGQLRDLIATMLRDAGYQILAAAGADEAIDLVRSVPRTIDLVVTDIVMPGMNGQALVQRLEAIRPGLRAIYMSGYTDEAIARRVTLEQGDVLLKKPFKEHVLLQAVANILANGATGSEAVAMAS